MKLNNFNHDHTNFGALHADASAKKIIFQRIKNAPQKTKVYEDLIKRAAKNTKVNIELSANSTNKSLCANLKTTSETIRYNETLNENLFSRLFHGGTLGFIKRCVKLAEIKSEKIIGAEHVTNFDYIDNISKNFH